jgi:hypothetical protein
MSVNKHSVMSHEFKVLGKGKKVSELLDLALPNGKRFPILGELLSTLSVLPVSIGRCKRIQPNTSCEKLQIIIATTNFK